MPPTSNEKRIYRFGIYEAHTSAGELRRNGARVKLQEQPFRVLVLLLERPGTVVSREEIRQALWSNDTFVDFDHGLNTVINKLRDALDDTAANPRFIETLARRGYRFVAPVEAVSESTFPTGTPAQPTPGHNEPTVVAPNSGTTRMGHPARDARSSLLTHPDELPSAPRGMVRGLFALIQVMYLCFYIASLAKLGSIERIVEPMVSRPHWIVALVLVSAAVGIPTRLYLLAGVAFDTKGFDRRFRKLFPFIFPLDELWALAPFLDVHQLGLGLAFAATAALLYLPFSQRTLVLMGYRSDQ